jgi:hypothetical protein
MIITDEYRPVPWIEMQSGFRFASRPRLGFGVTTNTELSRISSSILCTCTLRMIIHAVLILSSFASVPRECRQLGTSTSTPKASSAQNSLTMRSKLCVKYLWLDSFSCGGSQLSSFRLNLRGGAPGVELPGGKGGRKKRQPSESRKTRPSTKIDPVDQERRTERCIFVLAFCCTKH